MNVLLTGASGFLGSHLLESLLSKKQYTVYCLLRKTSSLKWIQNLNFKPIFFETDQLPSILKNIPFHIHYVIHCAASTKALHLKDYHHANVYLTQILAQYFSKTQSIKRFIFISTQAVAGPSSNGIPIIESQPTQPISDYGKTKLLAEQTLLQYSNLFPLTILRPCSIYGPRDTQFYSLFLLLKYRLSLLVNQGNNQVHLIYVKDFIQLIIECLHIDCPSGSKFFVHDGNIYLWKNILATAQKIYGSAPILSINLPLPLLKIVGLFNDFLSKITQSPSPLNSLKIQELIQPAWLCDASKIQKISSWHPNYSLTKGFQETLDFYQKYFSL